MTKMYYNEIKAKAVIIVYVKFSLNLIFTPIIFFI